MNNFIFAAASSIITTTLVHPVSASANGADGCKCLDTSPLTSSKYKVTKKNGDTPVDVLEIQTANQNFYTAMDYGLACKVHDDNLPPHCADLSGLDTFPQVGKPFTYTGTGKTCGTFGRPKWCEAKWCWVDPNKCQSAYKYAGSSYFPGAAYYSYETCGSSNSFADFVGAQETITLIENYMRTIKCQIEDSVVGSTTTCPNGGIPEMCGCAYSVKPKTGYEVCKNPAGNTPWGQEKLNFKLSGGFNRGVSSVDKDRQKCVEDAIAAHYEKIIELEYNMDTLNLGYLYSGQQEKGHFVQWPAIEWCSDEYDPRFRPWYSIVASGPKDVVIVIDRSGSMHKSTGGPSRMDLAKEAAIAVLKTLTWVDMVSVVAFNSDVITATAQPVPATSKNIDQIKAWISGIEHEGTTNFGALKTAMRFLVDARKEKGCWSTYCASTILFLTDGVPDKGTWQSSSVGELKKMNKECDDCVRIFTYALGAGADTTVTKEIAENFQGTAHSIADGGNLKDEMSRYYQSLVVERDTSLVRWVRYADAMTGEILLAGCTAIDDKKAIKPEDKLWGVVCMDANVAINLKQLAQYKGYADFVLDYETKARTCEQEKSGFQGASAMSIARELNCDEMKWSTGDLVCSPGQSCLNSESGAVGTSQSLSVILASVMAMWFGGMLMWAV